MERFFLLIVLFIVFCIIAIYGAYTNKKQEKYIKNKIRDSYGSPCVRNYADGEYKHFAAYSNNHESDYLIDDITWNDLDMDRVFMDMNYTQSSAGDEYLYYLLKNPSLNGENIEEFEDKVSHYMQSEENRFALQYALYKCGRTGKYSIYDYLNNLDVIDNENFNSDVWLILLYLVAIFVMFINLGIGIAAFVILLVYGGITYFIKKRRIEPYITSFAYVFRMIDGANKIIRVKDEKISREQNELKELTGRLTGFVRFSYLIMSVNSGTGNILEIILDYIRIFFHFDIIKFFQMRNEIKKHWDDIDRILTIMGRLDAELAIACYRAYLGSWCIPKFDSKQYMAEGIYHPLLSNPISNDVNFSRGVLLTGSNASGKSTMLKTIALAAILAQTINTVPASSYNAPRYRIYSSLALKDDIFAGESYYMTEIKSLKRILDSSLDESTPILALIDEVLRGTNTNERISASYVILKKLSMINGQIFAATHDIELAKLLDSIYDNYHFEENISANDISFNYKIMPGITKTRNAIKLLEIVGYDSSIIKEATLISEQFGEI